MRLGQSHKSRDVRYLGDADSYRTAQRAAGASIEQVEAEIAADAALVESGDSIPTDAVEPVTGPLPSLSPCTPRRPHVAERGAADRGWWSR